MASSAALHRAVLEGSVHEGAGLRPEHNDLAGTWRVVGDFIRHRAEPVWSGIEYTLSRGAMRRLFDVAAEDACLEVGAKMSVWTASMGRYMELWSIKRELEYGVRVSFVESGTFFYPGHEELTTLDRTVLWMLEQERMEAMAIASHIDRRSWLIDECFSWGDLQSHNLSWIDDLRTKGGAVKRRQLRRNLNRLVSSSIERLVMLGVVAE